MIKSNDISVIVQGNYNKKTEIELKSIRKFLPDCELILSTWEQSNITNAKKLCDKIILSKDPGAICLCSRTKKTNSINRIILSSKKGVEQATRKYILRLRSDLMLVNDNVLHLIDEYPCRNKDISLFKERIFTYELYSIKFEEYAEKKYYTPFHISDWCLFGLAEDIKLFHNNFEQVIEPDFSKYFSIHREEYCIFNDVWYTRTWRMSPEQYMVSENAKKVYPNLKFKHCLDINEDVIEASSQFIVNNFLIKNINEWGIITQKSQYKKARIKKSKYWRNGAWLNENWLLDYQKYCDNNYILPLKYTFVETFHLEKYTKKLNKNWNKVITPIKILGNMLCGVVNCIIYTVCIILKVITFIPIFVLRKSKGKH